MRNRRKKKDNQMLNHGIRAAVIIALGFAAVMIYWYQDSNCETLQKQKEQAEKQLKDLKEECQREEARWNGMNTPDGLREAIVRFGLEMNEAKPSQIVRMSREGRPLPGQLSLANLPKGGGTAEKRAERGTRKIKVLPGYVRQK